MSVLVVLKIPVDPADLRRAAGENQELMKAISGRGRDAGAIHHDFYEGDGEVYVVDEWDSAENFQAFFEGEGGNIGQLMQAANAKGEPAPPKFHKKMSLGDEF